MADHSLHLLISTGGYFSCVWMCEAGPEADCRNHCPDDHCISREDGCEDYDLHRPRWVANDRDECWVLPWLENSDWVETYSGPNTEVRSGPIELTWDGDQWTWRYAE